MAWKASSVSDYVLHRRRVFFACFGLAGAIAVLSGVAVDGRFSRGQLLTGLYAVLMLAYFSYMASREWKLMKASTR